jgi:hypothetical protein
LASTVMHADSCLELPIWDRGSTFQQLMRRGHAEIETNQERD